VGDNGVSETTTAVGCATVGWLVGVTERLQAVIIRPSITRMAIFLFNVIFTSM